MCRDAGDRAVGDGRASNAHLARLTETAVETVLGEGLLEDHLDGAHEVHGLVGDLLGGLDLHGSFFPARAKATGAGSGANGQRMRHRSEVLGVRARHGDTGGRRSSPKGRRRRPVAASSGALSRRPGKRNRRFFPLGLGMAASPGHSLSHCVLVY